MKVINILGSPRKKGTSARIAKSFTDAAKDLGGQVDSFYLNGMDYRGCQGCEQCHSKFDHCIQKDDLTDVLDGMRTAEIAVFSSPVYFGGTSGQFKKFLDRTWSQVKVDYENEQPFTSRLPHGKKAIFILCQADVEDKHVDIVKRYSEIFQLYGYDLKVIRATGLMSGMPDDDVSVAQKKAVELAHKLFKES
jgi:NAD(P)H-dependent FMN reductase